MRKLRLSVLQHLNHKPDHYYAIADHLHMPQSTVHQILACFEEHGVIEVVEKGDRGAKKYGLTLLGKAVLEASEFVDESFMPYAKSKKDVVAHVESRHPGMGKKAVDMALKISTVTSRTRDELTEKMGPDTPPLKPAEKVTLIGIFRDTVNSIITRGSRRVDSMRLKCNNCGHEGPVPKDIILPQLRAWASWKIKLLRWTCPDCKMPAELCIGLENTQPIIPIIREKVTNRKLRKRLTL